MKLDEFKAKLDEIYNDIKAITPENPRVMLIDSIDNMGSGTGNQIQVFHQDITGISIFFLSSGE